MNWQVIGTWVPSKYAIALPYYTLIHVYAAQASEH